MPAICFHGTEITCDMVSPDHADAMGFVYRESEIKLGEFGYGYGDGDMAKACLACGNDTGDYEPDDIFCGKCGEEGIE